MALAAAGVLALGVVGWWRLRRQNQTPAAVAEPSLLPLTERYLAAATREGGQMHWIPTSVAPEFLALTGSGEYLYAAGRDGRIKRIATSNDRVIGQWTLPGLITGMTIGRNGSHLYLTGVNPLLYVLDLTNGEVRSVNLPGAAVALVLATDGKSLYVAMPYEGLEKVDTASLQTTHWDVPPCPMTLAQNPANEELVVGFQCNGPGGTPGHDAIGVYNSQNGQLISSLTGEPRVGRAVAISPGGNEIWTDSGTACEEPQYDHRGCASVPSEMLEILGLPSRQMLANRAIPSAPGLPAYGLVDFFPGGARAFDGNYILDTTRLHALEVMPAEYKVIGVPAIQADGSHAFAVLEHGSRLALADFTPTPKACAPSPRNLLDWWPGDGSADDAWGLENGRPSPSAAYGPGISGQAFDLTRPGADVTIGPDHGLDLLMQAATVSAWVKFPAPGSTRPIVTKTDASAGNGWSLSLDSNDRVVLCQASESAHGCYAAPPALAPGRFHSVVLRAGQQWAELFLDGSLAGRTPLHVKGSDAQGSPWLLGTDASRTHFLAGWLDEVMVYKRALEPGEIASMARLPQCLAENHQ